MTDRYGRTSLQHDISFQIYPRLSTTFVARTKQFCVRSSCEHNIQVTSYPPRRVVAGVRKEEVTDQKRPLNQTLEKGTWKRVLRCTKKVRIQTWNVPMGIQYWAQRSLFPFITQILAHFTKYLLFCSSHHHHPTSVCSTTKMFWGIFYTTVTSDQTFIGSFTLLQLTLKRIDTLQLYCSVRNVLFTCPTGALTWISLRWIKLQSQCRRFYSHDLI